MEDKIAKALQFTENDVWDAVMAIIDKVIVEEVDSAISQNMTSELRAHQCGRAEGVKNLKAVLEEVHAVSNYRDKNR